MKTVPIIVGQLLMLLAGFSLQCEDRGGYDFCMFILRQKDKMCNRLTGEEIAECMKTCGVCKETTPPEGKGPPLWAMTPPVRRQPADPINNNSNKSDDQPLALPLYAVIIIVIAVLVIFIGLTVCVFKLKSKWKKRKRKKMDKNRRLLMNAPVLADETMHPNYAWMTGAYNGAYQPETAGWVGPAYPTGEVERNLNQNKTLNNKTVSRPEPRPGKNINILQNGTKDRRRAPVPPGENADSTYQNVRDLNENKTEGRTKPKAPAPPPQAYPSNTNVEEIPIEYSESVFSEAVPQEGNFQRSSWVPEETVLTTENDGSKKSQKAVVNSKNKNIYAEKEANDDDDGSDTVTVQTEETFSVVTEDTQQTAPALVNVLNEWKDHLQEQKKELEDYYKNLHNYVKRLGLKSAGAEQNGRPSYESRRLDHSAKLQKKWNISEPSAQSDRLYAGMHENYSGVMKFPEPPESVRGDFTWQPNDDASQKQVIVDLKKKLARLQNLLESAQDAAENEKMSPRFYMPSQHSKASKKQVRANFPGDRVTIKSLLQRLEERECLKVQVRIAQALDTSRGRGGMNIAAKDGPITCLSKQVHHVMNDLLDPRTSTKIELGAHAARTLAEKLLTSVHTNLLPVLGDEVAKRKLATTTDRISMLTKQLLDMTNQLLARQTSFYSNDYSVFVNAFVDTIEKVMDATFHHVCIIVELQREEKRGLVKNSASRVMPAPAATVQRQALPKMPQAFQQKDKLLNRLHSESNSTSLSAVDVRRLNQDLAKLRQLLDAEPPIPSFSDVTAPQNAYARNQKAYRDILESELSYGCQESECDTMSVVSCSTCAARDVDDQYGYDDELPHASLHAENDRISFPPPNLKQKKSDGKVQYTEVVFNHEVHRPATRPPKRALADANTLPQEAVELPKLGPMAAPDQVSQVASTSVSQRKASTLDPSSFASFHTEHDPQKNASQNRHQAMLARYFGGEPSQLNSENDRPVDNLKETLQKDELSPLFSAALKASDLDSTLPKVTMLPFGMVANDTPPIVNPPKEKKRMPRIPEITVFRNGSEEAPPSFEKNSLIDTANTRDILEKQIIAPSPEEFDLSPDYTTADTLPRHDRPEATEGENRIPERLPSLEEYPMGIASVDGDALSNDFLNPIEMDEFKEKVPLSDGELDLDADGQVRDDKSSKKDGDENLQDDAETIGINSGSSSDDSDSDETDADTGTNVPSDVTDNGPGVEEANSNAIYGGLISEFEFPRVDSPVVPGANEDLGDNNKPEKNDKAFPENIALANQEGSPDQEEFLQPTRSRDEAENGETLHETTPGDERDAINSDDDVAAKSRESVFDSSLDQQQSDSADAKSENVAEELNEGKEKEETGDDNCLNKESVEDTKQKEKKFGFKVPKFFAKKN